MELLTSALSIICVGVFSAMGALMLLRMHLAKAPQGASGFGRIEEEGIVYLFEGGTLIDATGRAASLLSHGLKGSDDRGRFLAAFAPRFPRLDQLLAGLAQDAPLVLAEREGDPMSLILHAELHNGITRIALIDPREANGAERLERYALQAMEIELDMLRSVAEQSPVLTWKQQSDGTVIWANSTYMAMVRREFGEEALTTWPPRTLFPAIQLPEPGDEMLPRRVSRPGADGEGRNWFELRVQPTENAALCFATPIDDLIQAESSLKEFIGTLGKTFAQLPIGLAIFDAKRRLVLFNPALIDLTGLGAEVLTQRPTLHSFLDALRENQRIPEPRDYKSWRLRIAQLEAAATDGRYKETWTLPTGQTYRVTGQPHPDGAVAFLFEDISSEILLKRRFRSEIELSLSVLNTLDHAMAVFTPDGTLSLSNRAYAGVWGIDPTTSLSRITLEDAVRSWGLGPQDGEILNKLRSFVLGNAERQAFNFTVWPPEGRPQQVLVRPLPQRASLFEFHATAEALALPQPAVGSTAG